jgi:hypothetical protein
MSSVTGAASVAGYGENSRVLAWIFRRCENDGEVRETPIGLIPAPADLDLIGLQLAPSALTSVLEVDHSAVLPQITGVTWHGSANDFLPSSEHTSPHRASAGRRVSQHTGTERGNLSTLRAPNPCRWCADGSLSVARLPRDVDSRVDLRSTSTGYRSTRTSTLRPRGTPRSSTALCSRTAARAGGGSPAPGEGGYRQDDTVLIVELDCAPNVARMHSACGLFATPEGEIDQPGSPSGITEGS